MADQEILIDVDGGKIECPRISAKKHDKLSWKCAHPFAVDFGWDTPFYQKEKIKNKKEPDAQGKKVSEPESICVDADGVGRRLKFKYTVAVFKPADPADPTTEDEVLIEDPEVLIDP